MRRHLTRALATAAALAFSLAPVSAAGAATDASVGASPQGSVPPSASTRWGSGQQRACETALAKEVAKGFTVRCRVGDIPFSEPIFTRHGRRWDVIASWWAQAPDITSWYLYKESHPYVPRLPSAKVVADCTRVAAAAVAAPLPGWRGSCRRARTRGYASDWAARTVTFDAGGWAAAPARSSRFFNEYARQMAAGFAAQENVSHCIATVDAALPAGWTSTASVDGIGGITTDRNGKKLSRIIDGMTLTPSSEGGGYITVNSMRCYMDPRGTINSALGAISKFRHP